jgi:hypothetical protein
MDENRVLNGEIDKIFCQKAERAIFLLLSFINYLPFNFV